MDREDVQRRWLAWRAMPWRRELLAALTEIFAAERAAAADDWRGLVVRLAMTQALDHVEWVASRRMHPRLVVLLVRVGRLTADAAVELLDVCSFAGGEALARLWRGLSPAGLQAALGRLRWGSYPDVPGDALVEMVARALELGRGEEALARVMGLDEPLRTRVLVALMPALTGELRAEVMARIEAIEDLFARVALLREAAPHEEAAPQEEAAPAVLGSSACTPADAMQAALRLPADEMARRTEAWCHDELFEQGRPGHVFGYVLAVLVRLAEAAEARRTEIVELARELTAGWSTAGTGWIDFAKWMSEEERVGLARRALVDVKDARVIGRVIGLAPEGMAVLADEIEEARKIRDAHERWSALGDLVAELPDEQGAALLRAVWARWGEPREIFAFPDWAMDAGLQRAKVAHELARPYRPYTAWLLGSYARPLPAAERGPVLDRAIEEFRAIAGAPTSPGNDAGPFVDMADLLDEGQVRRALEVVEFMAASASWGVDLECARQSLALRLAELGHVDEADARIRATTNDVAWGLGALVGQMLARGTGWDEVAARLDGEDVGQALSGVLSGMPAATRAGRVDVVEGFLRWLPRIADAEDREDALAKLMDGFAAAVPVERGVAAIREHSRGAVRAQLLLALAKVAGDAVLTEAVAALEDVEDLEDVIDEVCEVAERLPTATRIAVIARWSGGLPRRNSSLLQPWAEDLVGREIAAVLRAAGGDEALVTAAREVAAVARLLA